MRFITTRSIVCPWFWVSRLNMSGARPAVHVTDDFGNLVRVDHEALRVSLA